MTLRTRPCSYCGEPIPDSGIFGLPTYADVPENHTEGCPVRENMELRLADEKEEVERAEKQPGLPDNIVLDSIEKDSHNYAIQELKSRHADEYLELVAAYANALRQAGARENERVFR